MKVSSFNNTKVYNLSNIKSLPSFLSEKKKREYIKNNDDYTKRIELIQDFEITTSIQQIKQSSSLSYIFISGIYPPMIKCYSINEMSLKFQRGVDAEIITFECLSEDYTKIVFLQNNRNLNFHAGYGTHYNIRIPKFGRDLKYNQHSCDLFISGIDNEVYRLNLELGIF